MQAIPAVPSELPRVDPPSLRSDPSAPSTLPFGGRSTEAAVDEIFVGRWSPRSFLPSEIPEEDLRSLFEAARWAPSSNNEQPWLYVYATRPEDRTRFLSALAPGNQVWARGAPVLAFLFARRNTRDGRSYRTAPFDTGASWMSLALQARWLGLASHAIGGFDPERAVEVAGVDGGEFEPMIAIAIGRQGPRDALPTPLAEREDPNGRRPLAEVAREAGSQATSRARAAVP